MEKIFAGVNVGRKNIIFGTALFLILGVVIGTPLTVDLFGGSLLTIAQYQAWKVLHAYGVFLAFINFFFGYVIDRVNLSKQGKELASWSFVIAGLVGGIGRPLILLLSIPGNWDSYIIDLIETIGFVLGTFIFLRGRASQAETTAEGASEKHATQNNPV